MVHRLARDRRVVARTLVAAPIAVLMVMGAVAAGGRDAAGAGSAPVSSTLHDDADESTHGGHTDAPEALDESVLPLQPAYFNGRLVQYRFDGPAPDGAATDAGVLWEVEYPTGWQDTLARPLCFYCDHAGDGENAWDFHDHVLSALPDEEVNAAGDVYWTVAHIQPAYSENDRLAAEISAAYAALLPADSADEVDRLVQARLDDGTPIARVIDTGFVFTGPLTRQ